ncbi:hypothetical protein HID58_059763, partial [Brassica napus]
QKKTYHYKYCSKLFISSFQNHNKKKPKHKKKQNKKMVLFALTSSSSSSKLKQHSHRSFSESLMEDSIEDAEAIIHQWISPDSSSSSSSSFCCTFSLFSNKNREEAKQFMGAVTTLHSAMVKLISANPASTKLIRAESLLKTSMNHLSKENASKEDDDAEAMADLKMIADCMTSSGYGKECFTIYKKIRKSIIVEALEQLGFENLTLSQVQKLEWQSTEKKTRVWLRAVRKAVTTLFFGERILSDHVFSSSAAIRESSFAEITLQSALALFSFPGNVAKSRKTPEKIFLTLDVYQSIVELMPRIEEVFSYDSTSSVKSQIAGTLANLEEAVVSMIDEFESSISNESSKSVISNGGIHQLTRYVMNYIVFLADYSDTLANIIPETSSFASPEEDESTSSSSLSSPLAKRISEGWLEKHEGKLKKHVAKFEEIVWGELMTSLATADEEEAEEFVRRFSDRFEEVYKRQTGWVVPDSKLRDEIKVSAAMTLIPAYTEFYKRYRVGLRKNVGVAPEDIGNYISDLYFGSGESGCVSSVHSSVSYV